MAKLLIMVFALLVSSTLVAQTYNKENKPRRMGVGLKAGINMHYLQAAKSINARNNTGFFAGAYFAPPSRSFGYRTELLFSRQGYDYENNRSTGSVMLDYIMLPQLATLKVTKFIELHAGMQAAFLIKSRVDSAPGPSSVPDLSTAMNYFNKINYGFAGGLEIRPLAGLLIGGRYNLFLNMMKTPSNNNPYPSYAPPGKKNLQSGIVQLYVGYVF